jgi:mRNA interferase RelE/StbE
MAVYSVEIVSKAEKEYLRLPQAVKNRFQEIILSLEKDPRPFGSKKLRETDYYRIRSGDYRIVYSVDEKSREIKILSMGHRKEIYRSF